MTKVQKKNREFLEKLMGRDEYIITASDETDCCRPKKDLCIAFWVITLIVSIFIFVKVWNM